MTSLLRPWIVDAALALSVEASPSANPNCILLDYDLESRHGIVTDGTQKIKAKFSQDVVAKYADLGSPLESLAGGVMTLRMYSVYIHVCGSKQSAEFYLHVDDLAYHGGEDAVMSWSVSFISSISSVRERLDTLFSDWLKTNSLSADEVFEVLILENIDANYVAMSPDYTDTPEPGTVAGDVDCTESAFLVSESQQVQLEKLDRQHETTVVDELWEDMSVPLSETTEEQSAVAVTDGQLFSTQAQKEEKKKEKDSGNSQAYSSNHKDSCQADQSGNDQTATGVLGSDKWLVTSDKSIGGDSLELLVVPLESESVAAHEIVSHTPPSKKRHIDDGSNSTPSGGDNESSMFDEFVIPSNQVAQLNLIMMSERNSDDDDIKAIDSQPDALLEGLDLVTGSSNGKPVANPAVVDLVANDSQSKELRPSFSSNTSETEPVKNGRLAEVVEHLQPSHSDAADTTDEEKGGKVVEGVPTVSPAPLVPPTAEQQTSCQLGGSSHNEPPANRVASPEPMLGDSNDTRNELHAQLPITSPEIQDEMSSQSTVADSVSLFSDHKDVQSSLEIVQDVSENETKNSGDVSMFSQLSVCQPISLVEYDPPSKIAHVSDGNERKDGEEPKVIVLDDDSSGPLEASTTATTSSADSNHQVRHTLKEIDMAEAPLLDEMETDHVLRDNEISEQVLERMDDGQGNDEKNDDSLPGTDGEEDEEPFEDSGSTENPLSSSYTIPPYQIPKPTPPVCEEENSCSSTDTIKTSDLTPMGQILQKIMAYWRERHMENPVHSNILFSLNKGRMGN